jgi:hypothetical protein
VTAPDVVWDRYLTAHPEARPARDASSITARKLANSQRCKELLRALAAQWSTTPVTACLLTKEFP